MDEGEWIVVGSGPAGRRGGRARKEAGSAGLLTPHYHEREGERCSPPESWGGAALSQPASILPAPPPPTRRQGGRRNRQPLLSAEQRMQRLMETVMSCRAELLRSHSYHCLREAMEQAEPTLQRCILQDVAVQEQQQQRDGAGMQHELQELGDGAGQQHGQSVPGSGQRLENAGQQHQQELGRRELRGVETEEGQQHKRGVEVEEGHDREQLSRIDGDLGEADGACGAGGTRSTGGACSTDSASGADCVCSTDCTCRKGGAHRTGGTSGLGDLVGVGGRSAEASSNFQPAATLDRTTAPASSADDSTAAATLASPPVAAGDGKETSPRKAVGDGSAASPPTASDTADDGAACAFRPLHQGADARGSAAPAASVGCAAAWSLVRRMVILGLGSVEDSRVSRYQLALAVALQELLPGLEGPPVTFDPAYSEVDELLLGALGMQILRVNEGGRSSATRPTLFYMPHCEHLLYEALLSHNEDLGLLHNVVLLGNSLERYGDASIDKTRRWQDSGHTLLALVQSVCPHFPGTNVLHCHRHSGRVSELPVPCGRSDAEPLGAFNNTSLHLFPPSSPSALL